MARRPTTARSRRCPVAPARRLPVARFRCRVPSTMDPLRRSPTPPSRQATAPRRDGGRVRARPPTARAAPRMAPQAPPDRPPGVERPAPRRARPHHRPTAPPPATPRGVPPPRAHPPHPQAAGPHRGDAAPDRRWAAPGRSVDPTDGERSRTPAGCRRAAARLPTCGETAPRRTLRPPGGVRLPRGGRMARPTPTSGPPAPSPAEAARQAGPPTAQPPPRRAETAHGAPGSGTVPARGATRTCPRSPRSRTPTATPHSSTAALSTPTPKPSPTGPGRRPPRTAPPRRPRTASASPVPSAQDGPRARRSGPMRRRADRTTMLDPGKTGPIETQQAPDDGGPSTAVGLAPPGAEAWHRDRTDAPRRPRRRPGHRGLAPFDSRRRGR